MTLAGVKPGDVVACDVRGVRFWATVEAEPAEGQLPIRPHSRHVTYRTVKARQVIGIWSRRAHSLTP